MQGNSSGCGCLIAIIIVFVLLFAYADGCASGGSGSSSGSSEGSTCQVCDRTFTDSANKRSIARTNMCTNCYENYEYAQGARGQDVLGNPL